MYTKYTCTSIGERQTNTCKRCYIPELDGSVEAPCGQNISILWGKLTVKDGLHMTL